MAIFQQAGLGKTTVAKKVCEIVRERKHFDLTIWVCVSNDFNKVKILGAMLHMIDKTTGGLNSLDAILQNLKKELENKTFFLVLDDVWNEDRGKWDDLKEQLLKINSKNRNAIVVTMRSKKVADMIETSPGIQHEPGRLSADQCWSIIKQKVSSGGGATIASDLESIGKEIAKKCGGIPLLANVLGGTLHGKQAQEWKSILNSGIWDSQDGNKALRILRLSFDHLSSSSLKKCFAYCSILTMLILKDCSKSRQLPTLGCLPRLKILEMSGMPNMKCIGNEFYSSSGGATILFLALKELTLSKMDGFEEWMVLGGEVVAVFPSLKKLSIEECGKLKSIPICRLSSLVEFEIDGCDELRYLSGEFHGFTSLQILRIRSCSKLTSIPSVQHCTTLVELNIQGCRELISIPGDFRELKYSLKIVIVSSCKLGALPSGLQCCASLEQLLICEWSD